MILGQSTETVVANPIEFEPDLEEVGFDELGIEVREADWGESEMELFLIRKLRGEVPADRHPPNRTVTLKLKVGKDRTVNLAEAATRLQMVLGRWQEKGGWLKRVFNKSSQFENAVAYQVFSATAGGLHGWMMGHHDVAPEVTLAITIGPYCYSLKEDQSSAFIEETKRGLVYELPEVKGTAPGLRRVVIDNTGTVAWSGLILAEESEDYSPGATAELMYEAQKLTLLSSAAEASRTGASGGKVVRCEKVGPIWQAILGSFVVGSGHMSHVGTRRIKLRVFDPSTEQGQIKLKLEWRALGSPHWTENKIISAPLVGGFSLVDLGEVRPQRAVRGEQIWECRVCVMSENSATTTIDIDQLYPLPTEQLMTLQVEQNPQTPTAFKVFDQVHEHSVYTGETPGIGPVYKALTGSDTTDFSGAAVGGKFAIFRSATSDSGSLLAGGKGRGIGWDINLTNTAFQMDFNHQFGIESAAQATVWGQVVRYTDDNNYISVRIVPYFFSVHSKYNGFRIEVHKRKAGTSTRLFQSLPFQQGTLESWFEYPKGRLLTQIVGGRLEVFFSKDPVDLSQIPNDTMERHMVRVCAVYDSDFTISPLNNGDVYLYDESLVAPSSFRSYSLLVVWEPETIAVCYNGRSLECRSDGCYRQHQTEEAWGQGVPLGFLPYSAPSGLEARPSRGIIIPSQGDLNTLADEGTNKIKATVFTRAGYHFTSEAI